jgi:conjugative transfer signal peptidase TraF
MRRLVLSGLVIAVVVGCVWQIASRPNPLLVWNVTDSAPIGLYRRAPGAAGRNSWALIRTPDAAAELASRRHYLPRNVPMVKRIAAVSGDTVCRSGGAVRVNGVLAAMALERDHLGRDLPRWSGCLHLKGGELFLLNAPKLSFDSRYFGPVPATNVIERIEPLWTF